jgi:hypothetical protein
MGGARCGYIFAAGPLKSFNSLIFKALKPE